MTIILALPRSRTAWLSRFLSYRDWHCGHDELRHCRSFADIDAWLSQPNTNTIETAAAPWWRLVRDQKIVVIRRPVHEVVASLRKVGVEPDERLLRRLDHKLSQIAARTGCLSVNFADLDREETCAALFEHCLPYAHDHAHWAAFAPVNIQINMGALFRYCAAYRDSIEKLRLIASHKCLAQFARRPAAMESVTFQTETFGQWLEDARALFDDHLIQVGEAPGDWQKKNLPLMKTIHDAGAMQITTARCNGRMFGYLMTLIAPSLTSPDLTSAIHTTFYASPDFPGLGIKLQRAALGFLRERGAREVFFEAGKRGSGPRLGTLYKRLGAAEHGTTYRLEM